MNWYTKYLEFTRHTRQNDVKVEIMFCEPLKNTTKVVDITSMMNS
jgi:hypothetical protein